MKFFDHFSQQRVEFNFKFGRADRIGPMATPVEAPKPTGDDWTCVNQSDLKHSRAPDSKLLKQYDINRVEVAKKLGTELAIQLSIEEQQDGWIALPIDQKQCPWELIGIKADQWEFMYRNHGENPRILMKPYAPPDDDHTWAWCGNYSGHGIVAYRIVK